jgi:hypothetical protein
MLSGFANNSAAEHAERSTTFPFLELQQAKSGWYILRKNITCKLLNKQKKTKGV